MTLRLHSSDTRPEIDAPALSMIPAEDREAFVTACGIQKAIYQQKLAAILEEQHGIKDFARTEED